MIQQEHLNIVRQQNNIMIQNLYYTDTPIYHLNITVNILISFFVSHIR